MDTEEFEDSDPWLLQNGSVVESGCVQTPDALAPNCHGNGFHKIIKDIPTDITENGGCVLSNGDATHLTEIYDSTSHSKRLGQCFSSKKQLSITKDLPKHIRRYYKDQNALIETFEEVRENVENISNVESKNDRRTTKMASIMSKVTFAANLVLLAAKAVAAGLSASLVMISSMLDSCMDLVSGALMWWSNRAIKNTNYTLYPRGRRKLEPVAIVVLAVTMSFVSVQVIHESVQKIVVYATQNYDKELKQVREWMISINETAHQRAAPATFAVEENSTTTIGGEFQHWQLVPELMSKLHMLHRLLEDCAQSSKPPCFETPIIAICAGTILLKLILYLICRRIENPSVQALAKDHLNDVISNSGAIACGIIGYRVWVYADPLGAIIISLSIIINWSITAYGQIKMLTGYTAHPDFLKKITWIALNHDDRIQYIESVIAFHFGNRYLVEVTIVLPGEMTMRESHDLSEALQRKIERLPEVERAFVHIDYECSWIAMSSKDKVNDFTLEKMV